MGLGRMNGESEQSSINGGPGEVEPAGSRGEVHDVPDWEQMEQRLSEHQSTRSPVVKSEQSHGPYTNAADLEQNTAALRTAGVLILANGAFIVWLNASVGSSPGGFVPAIALLLVAVGLFRRKRWARNWALIWAVLGLVFTLTATTGGFQSVLSGSSGYSRLAVQGGLSIALALLLVWTPSSPKQIAVSLSVLGVALAVSFPLPGSVAVSKRTLEQGDCIEDLAPPGDEGLPTETSCSGPHDGEVVAVIEDAWPSDMAYPSDMVLNEEAALVCVPTYEPYVGVRYGLKNLLITPLLPSRTGWNNGDKRTFCVATDALGADLVGTVKGAGETLPNLCLLGAKPVACSEPHDYEAIAAPVLGSTADQYPSDIDDLAYSRCSEEFLRITGIPVELSGFVLLADYPSPEGWTAGYRYANCAVAPYTGTATSGSIQDGGS